MRIAKRLLACLMAMALLVCVPAVASAQDAAVADGGAQVFTAPVLHSITSEEDTGNGLAFLFTLNAQGAQKDAGHYYVADSATVTLEGVTYKVASMGAVVTNDTAVAKDPDQLVRENVRDNRTLVDVEAERLCDADAATCSFAVRIIHLPDRVLGFAVACRPYCVLEDAQGNEITLYGAGDVCTFNTMYYKNEPEMTPVLNLSVGDVDERLSVSATAEYAALCPATYREGFKVSLSLKNVSANAATSAGDYVTYAFKDAAGNVLATERVMLDVLNPADGKAVELYAPIATAAIEVTDSSLTYVPVITLPAIGSDIDVTKKKNRIRVSAASASFNEDGTVAVSLTFRNYSSNWITEETDYVKYTYYDAAGTAIKTETLYIGCIDTKKHPSKTFVFNLPAHAASVKITDSRIVYWTEWA